MLQVQENSFRKGAAMFTIYEYYDKKRLADTIRSAKGDVFLPMEDGKEMNLKHNESALSLLFKTGIGKEGLKVRLTDQADLISFMWLALQAV